MRLIDTHRDLSREQSELVNCKLILLLANHIGDADVLDDAMRRARDGVVLSTSAQSATPSTATNAAET